MVASLSFKQPFARLQACRCAVSLPGFWLSHLSGTLFLLFLFLTLFRFDYFYPFPQGSGKADPCPSSTPRVSPLISLPFSCSFTLSVSSQV